MFLRARIDRMLWKLRVGLWWKEPPPGWPYDPHAWKPAPIRPRPKNRAGAVALAEPGDDQRTEPLNTPSK